MLPTPAGLDSYPYDTKLDATDDYQNPQPALEKNPNATLQAAVKLIQPNHCIHVYVTTDKLKSGQGAVVNIPFEEQEADVTGYSADYWLLSTDGGSTYRYLAYSQDIIMELLIGKKKYRFPHVTSNTVTKVS